MSSVVVGSTVPAFKALSNESDQWLSHAKWMVHYAREISGLDQVHFFAAIEHDGRGLAPFTKLLDRLVEVSEIDGATATYWTFSLCDHSDAINGSNRLFRICTGRNMINEFALRIPDVEWVLYLDSDIVAPPESISSLLELDYPIVGGDVPSYCVTDETEALTKRGWLHRSDLEKGDELLTLDPESFNIKWQPLKGLNAFDPPTKLIRWQNHTLDVSTTAEHRWLVAPEGGAPDRFRTTVDLSNNPGSFRLALGGGTPDCFAEAPTHPDEIVELIGWVLTEGYYDSRSCGVVVAQNEDANPEHSERIRLLRKYFAATGATATEWRTQAPKLSFYFGVGIGETIRFLAPNKQLTQEFLLSLTLEQAHLLYQTLLDGDEAHSLTTNQIVWCQKDQGRIDSFQSLCSMLGLRTKQRPHAQSEDCSLVGVYNSRLNFAKARKLQVSEIEYGGKVWCPTVEAGTFMARSNGYTFWTGNCLGGPVMGEEYPTYPVHEHWNTAGFLMVNREIFSRVQWRSENNPGQRGLTDDPTFAADVRDIFGYETRVRKDLQGVHKPLVGLESRGHDLTLYEQVGKSV